ncbi:hypothetical protein CP10139811_1042 [Chlamydia ibidis]|uniref:Uncharacterized protein n=1 Tax=Chlamydia ibidis TaxID=1405396 RepID=S7J546_9CHLA|nr:hypothetical protein CP10139811_1042 [Chlamydia ibidis]
MLIKLIAPSVGLIVKENPLPKKLISEDEDLNNVEPAEIFGDSNVVLSDKKKIDVSVEDQRASSVFEMFTPGNAPKQKELPKP